MALSTTQKKKGIIIGILESVNTNVHIYSLFL